MPPINRRVSLMSGQQPWQAPDGRWYAAGQGSPSGTPPWPPGGREPPNKEKPAKESKLVAFREWLTTGTGIATLIVTIVGLLIGGAAAGGKLFPPSPKPTHSVTPIPPGPKPDTSPSRSTAPPKSLQSALLSNGTVGSAAIVQSSGTDLSQIGAICGGTLSGDTATAYETITDEQTGTVLDETLVSWDSAADADQVITAARQAVDQNGGCSVASNGVTTDYTGDNQGSPPSSCVSPGQYFSTQVKRSSSSSSFSFPYNGFAEIVRCGTTTIFVRVYSQQPGAITQQTADGYLSSAVSNGCGSFEVSWLRCQDEAVAVSGVVDAFVLAAQVEAPVGVEVAAGDQGAEFQDGLGAFEPPPCARYVQGAPSRMIE